MRTPWTIKPVEAGRDLEKHRAAANAPGGAHVRREIEQKYGLHGHQPELAQRVLARLAAGRYYVDVMSDLHAGRIKP